jgi:hypothetical protein
VLARLHAWLSFAVLYLSQAMCEHAYPRALSSSGFKVAALLRDCASSDTLRLMSLGGIGSVIPGTRLRRSNSTALDIVVVLLWAR